MSTTDEPRAENARWTEKFSLDSTCAAYGSDLCWKFADSNGCDSCYVHNIKETDDKRAACDLWDKTVRMLPTAIDELSESDTSWFSAGADPEPKVGYAVVDMANPEPYTTKGMIFGYGKKVRTPVGSLVTLHIAIGKKGMRAFRAVEWIRLGWFVGMIALAFVMLALPQISGPMVNFFVLTPAIFLVLMGAAGYAIGRSVSTQYMKRHSDEVNFDTATIPLVADMLKRDWYFFQSEHGRPRMTFTRRRDFKPLLPPRECS